MKYIILALTIALPLFSTHAEITKKYDNENDCQRYSVLHKVQNQNGDYVFERELEDGETIFKNYVTTGMTLKKLNINFEEKEASFVIKLKMPLRVNRALLGSKYSGKRTSVSSSNPAFNQIINTVNADINLLDEVCINNDKIKYVKFN